MDFEFVEDMNIIFQYVYHYMYIFYYILFLFNSINEKNVKNSIILFFNFKK